MIYKSIFILISSIHYTLRLKVLKKVSSDKINGTKLLTFFFGELQLITVSLLICDFYMSWSTRLVSLKLFGIFHFWLLLVFIKVYNFVQQNTWTSSHISFQNKNDRKATQSFAPTPLIFKLQQELLKFNDISVSWSWPKTDVVTNLLSLENRNFENISFSQ